MISRVAENCFWLGRYLERAESTARVLGVTHNLALDAELPPEQCWRPVLITAGEEPSFLERFGADALEDPAQVEAYMTWDDANLSSVVCSARALRENARSIRDVVSLDAWEAINDLYLYLRGERGRADWVDHRQGFYTRVRSGTQLALGLMRSTMLHDLGLDFIWLGVMLERAAQTARLLDVHHHALAGAPGAVESAVWLTILRACSGFEPFMKRARGQVGGRAVASFLLLEAQFPRSIRYCVHAANSRLNAIRPPEHVEYPGAESAARLRALDAWVAKLGADAMDAGRAHDVLTRVVDEIAGVCMELGRELFGVAEAPAPAPAPAAVAVTVAAPAVAGTQSQSQSSADATPAPAAGSESPQG